MHSVDDGRRLSVSVRGSEVMHYVYRPDLPVEHSPRPFCHPIRTLAGTVITAAAPADHPWHYGLSLALPMVSGVNFWGGPTYLRGQGYRALTDHGRVEHLGWADPATTADRTGREEMLQWLSPDRRMLLSERRRIGVRLSAHRPDEWCLDFAYQLRNETADPVVLGSPGSAGRPAAGYGGLFLRCAESLEDAAVFDSDGQRDAAVFGSLARSVLLRSPRAEVELGRTDGPGPADPWFVRTDEYAGVCAALAFQTECILAPRAAVRRTYTLAVRDRS